MRNDSMIIIQTYIKNNSKSETHVSFKNNICKTTEGYIGLKQLNDEQICLCEGEISIDELYNTLKTFPKNKTPGNDGLSGEFYLKFWNEILELLLQSYKDSFEVGELSTSQKQSVILLVEKEGKDKSLIKNWRPISLINIDAKLISKCVPAII